MRRIALIVSVAVLTTIHPLASDTFLNLGYNIQSFPTADISINSLGLVWTVLPAGDRGYYGQLVPYFALSGEQQGFRFNYSDYGMFGAGLNFTMGYGRKYRMGSAGLLLGGGFVGDAFGEYSDYYGFLDFVGTFGVGGGAHLYFTVPGTVLSLNLGIDGSWRPAGVWVSESSGAEFRFFPSNFNTNVNAGLMFRSPSRRERAVRRAAKPRWDAEMTGPRRRIAVDAVFGGGSMGSVRFWVFPVRDLWFIRAGTGFTIPSATPLLVNVPVSLATGIYPFPRRLKTLRVYAGILDTVNVVSYLEGRGVSAGGHYMTKRLWQNLGIMVGTEYNFSSHLGISIEPSFYPLIAAARTAEGSSFQLALAIRVM